MNSEEKTYKLSFIYVIYWTYEEVILSIESLLKEIKVQKQLTNIEISCLGKNKFKTDREFKMSVLNNAFMISHMTNTPLFIFGPDHFCANSSLSNILKISQANNDFFINHYARVNWDPVFELIKIKFKNNPDCTIDNRELVKIGLDHLIDSQKLSIENDENFGVSGLFTKQIKDNTYAITSSRPAPIFGGITKSDLSFFRKFSHFNYNDFLWPRKLIREGRAKYINDSDICHIIELCDNSHYEPLKLNKEGLRMKPYGGTKRLLNHKLSEFITFFWKI